MDRKICISVKRKERNRHGKQARHPARDFSKKKSHLGPASRMFILFQCLWTVHLHTAILLCALPFCLRKLSLGCAKNLRQKWKMFCFIANLWKCVFLPVLWWLGFGFFFFSFSHGSNPGWIDLDVQIKFHPK